MVRPDLDAMVMATVRRQSSGFLEEILELMQQLLQVSGYSPW
jgi:hypothetical protein